MPRITTDMTGVTTEFTPLPVGSYTARVEKVEQRLGKDSGQPYVAWTFTLTEPGFEGRKAFLNTTLQKKGLFALKRCLLALGWDEDELQGEIDFDTEDLIDQECTVVLVPAKDQNGAPTTAVECILPPGEATGPTDGAPAAGGVDLGDDLSTVF